MCRCVCHLGLLKKALKQEGSDCLKCWYVILAISNLHRSEILRIPNLRYKGFAEALALEFVIVRIASF